MDTNLDQILLNLQISEINQLQKKSYSQILLNSDVMIVSPTGSGKTLAFLLPIFSLLKEDIKCVQCIIIVPSRELALQIYSVWRKMNTGINASLCYGGHDITIEYKSLSNTPALVITTPGRLLDHIERQSIDGSSVKYLVLDEFDKSLELGFYDQMNSIFISLTNLKKRVFVSATSDVELSHFVNLDNLLSIKVESNEVEFKNVSYYVVISEDKDKAEKLFQLLCSLNSESAIIFCNHRDAVERISNLLTIKGIQIGYYHGGLDQIDRERVLVQFRNGSLSYLVATDLAARGLDIPTIKHVIHYHLPSKESELIHRNGRTARMGADGSVYLLLFDGENTPEYLLSKKFKEIKITDSNPLPKDPPFRTLYISGGRKNKLSKADIVGFLIQKGELRKEDLGMIELKDFFSFVAVRREKIKSLLSNLMNQKLKGKKYKIELARTI